MGPPAQSDDETTLAPGVNVSPAAGSHMRSKPSSIGSEEELEGAVSVNIHQSVFSGEMCNIYSGATCISLSKLCFWNIATALPVQMKTLSHRS